MVNMILTALHIAFVLFIIVMGFWRGDVSNFTHPADPTRNPGGFAPYGASGVFYGAATVYLSFIGYDAVSTMAEEVRDPIRDIPIGVSGSVAIVTVLYCLMAASMAMLVPYDAVSFPPNSLPLLISFSFTHVREAERLGAWLCGGDFAPIGFHFQFGSKFGLFF